MNFIAMDFETANYQKHSACSLALVMVRDSKVVGEYYTLIQPETDFFWKNYPNPWHSSGRRRQCS